MPGPGDSTSFSPFGSDGASAMPNFRSGGAIKKANTAGGGAIAGASSPKRQRQRRSTLQPAQNSAALLRNPKARNTNPSSTGSPAATRRSSRGLRGLGASIRSKITDVASWASGSSGKASASAGDTIGARNLFFRDAASRERTQSATDSGANKFAHALRRKKHDLGNTAARDAEERFAARRRRAARQPPLWRGGVLDPEFSAGLKRWNFCVFVVAFVNMFFLPYAAAFANFGPIWGGDRAAGGAAGGVGAGDVVQYLINVVFALDVVVQLRTGVVKQSSTHMAELDDDTGAIATKYFAAWGWVDVPAAVPWAALFPSQPGLEFVRLVKTLRIRPFLRIGAHTYSQLADAWRIVMLFCSFAVIANWTG